MRRSSCPLINFVPPIHEDAPFYQENGNMPKVARVKRNWAKAASSGPAKAAPARPSTNPYTGLDSNRLDVKRKEAGARVGPPPGEVVADVVPPTAGGGAGDDDDKKPPPSHEPRAAQTTSKARAVPQEGEDGDVVAASQGGGGAEGSIGRARRHPGGAAADHFHSIGWNGHVVRWWGRRGGVQRGPGAGRRRRRRGGGAPPPSPQIGPRRTWQVRRWRIWGWSSSTRHSSPIRSRRFGST